MNTSNEREASGLLSMASSEKSVHVPGKGDAHMDVDQPTVGRGSDGSGEALGRAAEPPGSLFLVFCITAT